MILYMIPWCWMPKHLAKLGYKHDFKWAVTLLFVSLNNMSKSWSNRPRVFKPIGTLKDFEGTQLSDDLVGYSWNKLFRFYKHCHCFIFRLVSPSYVFILFLLPQMPRYITRFCRFTRILFTTSIKISTLLPFPAS